LQNFDDLQIFDSKSFYHFWMKKAAFYVPPSGCIDLLKDEPFVAFSCHRDDI